MEFPLQAFMGALVTLTVAGLGYLQWRRTKRSGRYIEDREAAYKAVWHALEEIHLYVRTDQFDEPAFNALLTKANTLLLQHGLHISERDKQLARSYMAALRAFGRVLGQIDASAPPRHDLALTVEGVAMPPELQPAYQAYESARRATMESFRSAIGAGQI